MQQLVERIHALSPSIRYVAVYQRGALMSSVTPALANASSAESDKYEELIVNPTLLTLLSQRGDIDCGGLQFVLIRYGSFFEYVVRIDEGHLSVGIAPDADVMAVVAAIVSVTG